MPNTRGPFVVDQFGDGEWQIRHGGTILAESPAGSALPYKEAAANGYLFASAPELKAALIKLLGPSDPVDLGLARKLAVEALAKSEGRNG